MSPSRGVTLAGLAKKYPKNGGVRKANWFKQYLFEKTNKAILYIMDIVNIWIELTEENIALISCKTDPHEFIRAVLV
jgi:hypothetical protein